MFLGLTLQQAIGWKIEDIWLNPEECMQDLQVPNIVLQDKYHSLSVHLWLLLCNRAMAEKVTQWKKITVHFLWNG